ALNPNLVESELFGHVKGAFTGAAQARPGLLALADGGTIFFDELADIPLAVQVKLLRVLEHSEALPVGRHAPPPLNVPRPAAPRCPPGGAAQGPGAGRTRRHLPPRPVLPAERLPDPPAAAARARRGRRGAGRAFFAAPGAGGAAAAAGDGRVPDGPAVAGQR